MQDAAVVYPDADRQLGDLISGGRLARLEALGGFAMHMGRPDDDGAYLRRLGRARGVLLGWDMPASVLQAAPCLEVVSFTGTGAAKFIDLDTAAASGVTVTNTPRYADNAVAEHALSLTLAVVRRVAQLDRSLRAGRWEQGLPGFELRGRTLGLVGFGGIAARFAEIARAIGMEVIAWTRHPDRERGRRHGVTFAGLDAVLGRSDVVSLHLPFMDATRGFLGAGELGRLKPEAVLINTARGEILDEDALVHLLSEGHIAGAGLDVFHEEPIPRDHPLTRLDNVVLTPHVAFNTPEATAALLDIAIANLERYFAGEPVNVVARPTRGEP